MLIQLSSFTSILLLIGKTGTSSAFTLASNTQGIKSSSALHATIEGTALKAPSDIPMDDVPGLFDKYVQKTYG